MDATTRQALTDLAATFERRALGAEERPRRDRGYPAETRFWEGRADAYSSAAAEIRDLLAGEDA